jgi:DNA-binding transcriptional ArsR family regulator
MSDIWRNTTPKDKSSAVIISPMKALNVNYIPGNEQHELAAWDLAATFSTISRPAMPKHLLKLRNSGKVSVRVQAQQRIYNLEPKTLAELDAWIVKYKTVWPERLDTLEQHLSTTKKEQRRERP